MTMGKWALSTMLAAASILAPAAEPPTLNERLVQLSDILGPASTYSTRDKLRAIHELGVIKAISGIASGLLFDRANIRFEPDPVVREAAAMNIKFVCELRNRMAALRLARFTCPANEPEPAVRIGALTSLAAFQTAEAASSVYDAANEAKEPDPGVRAAAKELIERGLASSLY